MTVTESPFTSFRSFLRFSQFSVVPNWLWVETLVPSEAQKIAVIYGNLWMFIPLKWIIFDHFWPISHQKTMKTHSNWSFFTIFDPSPIPIKKRRGFFGSAALWTNSSERSKSTEANSTARKVGSLATSTASCFFWQVTKKLTQLAAEVTEPDSWK